jgi:hypothetical protein
MHETVVDDLPLFEVTVTTTLPIRNDRLGKE